MMFSIMIFGINVVYEFLTVLYVCNFHCYIVITGKNLSLPLVVCRVLVSASAIPSSLPYILAKKDEIFEYVVIGDSRASGIVLLPSYKMMVVLATVCTD